MPPTRWRCARCRCRSRCATARWRNSESAEGDDLGLRVLVGKRQAVVSTNDTAGDGSAALAARAVAMARAAPEDKYAGLADAALLAHDFPDLDLIDPDLPTVARARSHGARGRSGRARGQGRHQVGRRLGLGRHRRHGAGDQPPAFAAPISARSHGVSMTAIAGEGTGMERDYDYSSVRHAADLESPEKIGRTAGERAVERLNPRKVTTRKVPVVFDPRVAGSLVVASRQRRQRRLGRAQDQLPARQDGRRSCSPTASASSTIRCASAACARIRSTARASPARSWR